MLAIGMIVVLTGYGLTYWGNQLWNGCGQNSLLDIMWPGGSHFTPCSGSTAGGGSTSSTAGQNTLRTTQSLLAGSGLSQAEINSLTVVGGANTK